MNEEVEEVKTEDTKLMKGELTGDALALLENQNPKLLRVIFEGGGWAEDGEICVVYVKNFNRPMLTQALQIREKGDLVLGEWILLNLRVGGVEKDEILNDANMLNNFSATASYLIRPKIGAIKKK